MTSVVTEAAVAMASVRRRSLVDVPETVNDTLLIDPLLKIYMHVN